MVRRGSWVRIPPPAPSRVSPLLRSRPFWYDFRPRENGGGGARYAWPLRAWARREIRLRSSAIAVAFMAITFVLAPGPRVEAAPLPNGLTAINAAPSCWAIKQAYPASASGQFWLQTPTLVTAQKFYCDMTTDGGGWVLVGPRPRRVDLRPQRPGFAGTVRGIVGGTSAFAPAALSASAIDGAAGRRPARRAGGRHPDPARGTNQNGTCWQEVRWHISIPRSGGPGDARAGTSWMRRGRR